jgi:hypothetical protein
VAERQRKLAISQMNAGKLADVIRSGDRERLGFQSTVQSV